MKKFISFARYEDIITVLIGVKVLIPEDNCRDLKILENGFYLFHFKSKPRLCAEFMMRLPNGPVQLENIMRKDGRVTFDLVHKIVIDRRGNNEIISRALRLYSGFVNDQIVTYNTGIHYYTYLLHEACANGNAAAVSLLLNYGADPNMKAGNSIIGPRKTVLHYAITDLNGIDTLVALLERHEPVLSNDDKKNMISVLSSNFLIPDELKSRKIQVLKRFGII